MQCLIVFRLYFDIGLTARKTPNASWRLERTVSCQIFDPSMNDDQIGGGVHWYSFVVIDGEDFLRDQPLSNSIWDIKDGFLDRWFVVDIAFPPSLAPLLRRRRFPVYTTHRDLFSNDNCYMISNSINVNSDHFSAFQHSFDDDSIGVNAMTNVYGPAAQRIWTGKDWPLRWLVWLKASISLSSCRPDFISATDDVLRLEASWLFKCHPAVAWGEF